jgi:molybdate transport system substrate-binding protein
MEVKKISSLILILIFLILVVVQNAQSSSKRILVFAGAASKPSTEDAVKIFQEKTGISVDVSFGGHLLSRILGFHGAG